ncbi:MAG: HAMP domain-containing sensor histidine kinase [Oscillospiraceae bacterium]|nr:HAMP domain-containing sensor histidine kinase [Oscillospiraceae bacterium]
MRDSLFRRYINIFISMLLLCTVMLGLAFLYFSAQNFSGDKQLSLQTAAEHGRDLALEGVVRSPDGVYSFDSSMSDGFRAIYDTSGTTVFFCDEQGNVLLCSEGAACTHTQPMPAKMLALALKHGSYASAGYFDGVLKKTRGLFLYCVPVVDGDTVLGYVFASTPITPIYTYLINLGITFLASTGVMLVGSVLIIYYATKRLTQPLREMSNAARSFGKGDFSARVQVAGDDEMAHLADAFNNMAESLSELEKTRRSFIANVSHELRTPMTTIGGYIDGILDGTIPRSRENHYLQIASDEVKRLSRLTSSLLDIARMEEGNDKVALKNCNAWDIILSVLWNAERRINDKHIQVTDLDVRPAYIRCDPDMFYQVIYNLIDNAVKFTPDKGVLTVRVEPAGAVTVITVRNSGDGIAVDELQHVFERFYKTDKSRGLDKTGTGLGLYIVKTLVTRMDGSIAAQSELHKYTEFILTFTTGTEEKGARAQKSPPMFTTRQQETPPAPVREPAPRPKTWLEKLGKPFKKGK